MQTNLLHKKTIIEHCTLILDSYAEKNIWFDMEDICQGYAVFQKVAMITDLLQCLLMAYLSFLKELASFVTDVK